MENSLAIANMFISIGNFDAHPPTHLKLQKLLYFAHGWHLALFDAPLVEEEFLAWKHGPVIPSVYMLFKSYGASPITREGTIPAITNAEGKVTRVRPSLSGKKDKLLYSLVRKIQDVYGKYNGKELSFYTHIKGSPWSIAYGTTTDPTPNLVISNNSIKKHFIKKIDHEQSHS